MEILFKLIKIIYAKSNSVVTGLNFYDIRLIAIIKLIKPYPCGELEITDINKYYL